MAEVLIAEDDADVRKWLTVALESEGYAVRAVADGEAATAAVAEKLPDLVILDVTMPRKDGIAACRELRTRHPRLPILMLTARDTDEDRLAGYEAGVDDYATKPFSIKVLFARIAALLRRAGVPDSSRRSFTVGSRRVDGPSMSVTDVKGNSVPLAAREYELLSVLESRRGEVVDRNRLLNLVWGMTYYGNTRTLDQHVALLRRKLGGDAQCLITVRNVGYKLADGGFAGPTKSECFKVR